MTMLSDQEMRAAVAARDRTCDGRFVYAVVTTGSFCKPSCHARQARAENLRFFPDARSHMMAATERGVCSVPDPTCPSTCAERRSKSESGRSCRACTLIVSEDRSARL